MNKLTLAAAVAFTMAVSAKAADCTDNSRKPCPTTVYDFVVSLRTTEAKGKAGKDKGVCYDKTDSSCYRVKGSKNLKGYVVLCSCWCTSEEVTTTTYSTNITNIVNGGAVTNGTDFPGWQTNSDWNVSLPVITNTTKSIVEGTSTDWSAYLWDKKAGKFYADNDDFTWTFVGLIGKKQKDFEGYWTMDAAGEGTAGLWQGAGFGAWDSKNDRLKSANGTLVVAFAQGPSYLNKKASDPDECDCIAPLVDPCTLTPDDSGMTVGFGNWKLKYNSKASKTYDASGIDPLIPKKLK